MANTLGNRISTHRKRLNLTQEQLAEKLGLSCQAVSKWENDLSCPDITLLPQLADLFGITVDELLRGGDAAVQVIPEQERKDFNKMIMKVLVTSADGDVVRVNLPLSLVKVALEVGMQMPEVSNNDSLKNVDFASILLAAEKGVIGKIVEVKSADGDNVDIVIE